MMLVKGKEKIAAPELKRPDPAAALRCLTRPNELKVGLHICVHWSTATNAGPRIVMIGGVDSHWYVAPAAHNWAPINMPAGSRCGVL